MGRALRAVACVAVAALFTAACGTDGDTAIPVPTVTSVSATAVQVTAEPSTAAPAPTTPTPAAPTITPTPKPEPTLFVHSSGLACYGKHSTSWTDMFDPGQVVGLPTLEEAAALWWSRESIGRWWQGRDGRYSISAEDLIQHPSRDDTVTFRDGEGNAQVVLHALQLSDGTWIIDRGESCA